MVSYDGASFLQLHLQDKRLKYSDPAFLNLIFKLYSFYLTVTKQSMESTRFSLHDHEDIAIE